MTEIGRNPARIIPAWRDFVNAHADAPALRGVGEPFFPGRNAAARDECHAHEALLNVGLADAPIRLVCPYDVERLTPADIERVLANHPIVEVDGHRRSNPRVATVEWLGMPLPEPPTGLVEFDFGITSLFQLRRVVEERTRALAFTDARREEIVLVASEIATNSLRHGGGRGLFRCWSEGATFVCEALDSGWIREPMIGRVRPRPGQAGGHGVWLANQLADLVQIRSAEGRTVVRMFFTA
jgi:anti-sigma regulatory factor (Ser/Thr protein kinase)